MLTDMELFIVVMESNCYTFLELGKITHDSSVHRTHIAHRVVLLGVGSALLKIVLREGPFRVFTDMELLFVGMESICYTILELGKIIHDSSVHRTHIAHRVVLLGVWICAVENCSCAKVLVGCLQTWNFYL